MNTENTQKPFGKVIAVLAVVAVLIVGGIFAATKFLGASAQLDPVRCEEAKVRFDRVVAGNACYPELGTSTTHIENDIAMFCGADVATKLKSETDAMTDADKAMLCEKSQQK
ncbi:hypothetical protein HMPREF0044_1267 [Gleimia coleocanis DSM 15436]|uniref:Uncharacterized protein n=1 Tax=Gleimia coleocanis DSM 15436 TaxID=525245 RepID=C0W1H7_9ACTO|nr:hypothetical protein [Gleimia coleocanis]EEH63343.1 hypothetical protein HMPREF0044_1267 [Gleimia coleocanis DSM 15436]